MNSDGAISVQVTGFAKFQADGQAYWQAATAPWRQRKTQRSYWGLVTVAVMIGLLSTLAGFAVGVGASGHFDQRALWVAGSFLGSFTLVTLWGLQVSGMMLYNHPVSVRLVPGYLAVHRRVAVGLWVVLAFLLWLLVWWMVALVPDVALPGLLRHPFLVFVISAAVLLVLAISVRWARALLALWFGGQLLLRYAPALVDLIASGHAVLLDHPYPAGLLLLVAMGLLLAFGILGSGSASHHARYARRAKYNQLMKQDPTGMDATLLMVGGTTNKWLQPFCYPYASYLRWQLQHATAARRSVMARLDIALAGNNHWVMQWSNLVWIVVIANVGLICIQAIWGVGWADLFKFDTNGGSFTISMVLIGAAFSAPLAIHHSMLRSQRAQGLLALLPGVPQGRNLNQALAQRHLLQLAAAWLALAAAVVVFPWSEGARTFAWLVWIAYVPLLPLVFKDWSQVQVLTGSQTLGRALMICPGLAIAALLYYYLHLDIQWIAAVWATAFALHTAWRWRKLAGYGQALPVGRSAHGSAGASGQVPRA